MIAIYASILTVRSTHSSLSMPRSKLHYTYVSLSNNIA